MKRLVPLASLTALLVTSQADAAAVSGGDKPVLIHEDYVLVHHDEQAKRMHVLFAARVAPAAPKIMLGFPTTATPTIEVLPIDLAAAVHGLVAPHEMRLKGKGPAAPAPWLSPGAQLTGVVLDRAAVEVPFAAEWTKSYVDKGFFIAALDVATPADDRVEVLTPTAHISYAAEKFVLLRREPPLPRKEGDPETGQDKPLLPFELTVGKIEPSTLALTGETLAGQLRSRPGALIDCYERFLERRPGETVKMSFETIVRPKGEIASIREAAQAQDRAGKDLEACTVTALRQKELPRASEGYRFTAELVFTPPRVPLRRTHIVTVGSSRQVWKDVPDSVRVLQDFEIPRDDVQRALREDLRKAIGLRESGRVWVTHWLDRDVRRTMAADAELVREDLPQPGEPGTLPEEPTKPKTDVHGHPMPRQMKVKGHESDGKILRTTAVFVALAATLVLALWIARDDLRA